MFSNVLIVGLEQEREQVVFVFLDMEKPGNLRVFASLGFLSQRFPLVGRV